MKTILKTKIKNSQLNKIFKKYGGFSSVRDFHASHARMCSPSRLWSVRAQCGKHLIELEA